MRRKKPMQSRTMWFSFALVILGVVYDNFSYVQNIIDPRIYGIVLIGVGICVAILRFITSEPLK
jgi:uncharacterized membrane protein YdcZ (DUF606 family)